MTKFLETLWSTLGADATTVWRSAVAAVGSGHAVAVAVLVAVSAAVLALAARPFWRVWRERFSRLGWVERAGAVVLLLAAISYGSTKPVYNAGADTGIALVGVFTEYDPTNDVTAVEVKFTGGNVGVLTPVSVRNSDRDLWSALVKNNPAVTVDLPTNVLSFAVSGNASTNRYWWVGSDTPAVIVETVGVTVTNFVASSKFVSILWTCDDPKATVFEIQRRRNAGSQWTTVGTTEEFGFVYSGFTVGETWQWRVSSTYADVTEGDE